MKALARRSKACAAMGRTGMAAMVLWAAALGQATPDAKLVTEPSTVALFGLGVLAAGWIARGRKK